MLPEADKEDLCTIIDALQHQNFCLCNTVSNLIKQWPNTPHTTHVDPLKSGISSETKD